MLHNYFDVYPTCLSNMFFGMSFQFVAHMCRIFSFMNFVIITTSVWFETAILTLQKPNPTYFERSYIIEGLFWWFKFG